MKTCIVCGKLFDPSDSFMGEEDECQLCWEDACNTSWWEFMRQLDILDGRKFEREVPEVTR